MEPPKASEETIKSMENEEMKPTSSSTISKERDSIEDSIPLAHLNTGALLDLKTKALGLAQEYKSAAFFQYNQGKYGVAASMFSDAIEHAELHGQDLKLLGDLFHHRGICQFFIRNDTRGFKDFRMALKFMQDCTVRRKLEEGLKIWENRLQTGKRDELGINIRGLENREWINSEGNSTTPSLILQRNPLLIDLILDATLSHLPLKDLLSCRLVCEVWNRYALPKVKEKCPQLILSEKDLTLPNRRGRSGFLPTMENAVAIPCSKFQLRLPIYNPDLSTFQELIDVCQSVITSLHLSPLDCYLGFPTAPGPDTNKLTFQKWMRDLKNLKQLTITDFDFGVLTSTSFFEPGYDVVLKKLQEFEFLQVGPGGKPSSQFFDGFFRAAQNLKKMTLGARNYRKEFEAMFPVIDDEDAELEHDESDAEEEGQQEDDESDDENEHTVFDLEGLQQAARLALNVVLNSFLNHGKLDVLKSITFHLLNDVHLSTLVSIGKKGLKLEEFYVEGTRFGKIKFCEFLETQKKTLKTLIIKGEEETPGKFSLKFPTEMKELRELDICINGPLKISKPFCYSTGFPKLRKLHVVSGHRSSEYVQNVRILDTFFTEKKNLVACETLKDLKMSFTLSDEEEIDGCEIILRMIAIFPKMKIHVNLECVDDDEDDRDYDDDGEMTLDIFGS